LPGGTDNASNNARCTQARNTTHGLDGQHQYVGRTPHGRVNQNCMGSSVSGTHCNIGSKRAFPSAVLLTFSFQFSLLFFHVGSQAATSAYVVYPISDIERRTLPKMWEVHSLYAAYSPGERLLIDSNSKN